MSILNFLTVQGGSPETFFPCFLFLSAKTYQKRKSRRKLGHFDEKCRKHLKTTCRAGEFIPPARKRVKNMGDFYEIRFLARNARYICLGMEKHVFQVFGSFLQIQWRVVFIL